MQSPKPSGRVEDRRLWVTFNEDPPSLIRQRIQFINWRSFKQIAWLGIWAGAKHAAGCALHRKDRPLCQKKSLCLVRAALELVPHLVRKDGVDSALSVTHIRFLEHAIFPSFVS